MIIYKKNEGFNIAIMSNKNHNSKFCVLCEDANHSLRTKLSISLSYKLLKNINRDLKVKWIAIDFKFNQNLFNIL